MRREPATCEIAKPGKIANVRTAARSRRVIKQSPLDLTTGGLSFFLNQELLDIAWALLAIALACESFFGAALFTRFQVERMPLDLFYDIFLLDLAFEAAQRTFKSFSLLQMDF